ncbi:PepSY domain-containing protein, partial [Stutzerimonas stutzeri]
GQEIPGQGTLGQQFHLLQPAIHGGRILGLPGRILIAVLGVAIAVLSVTGVVIWWRKLSARRQTAARRGAVAEVG